jgi:hypothetical protein
LEAAMTQDKDKKRKVREYARRTGRSYSDARRLLLSDSERGKAMTTSTFKRFFDTRYGFGVSLPDGWNEFPPDPTNSAYEVARFLRLDPTHQICLVFRMPGRAGLSPRDPAERSRARLARKGFQDFVLTDVEIASRPGVLLSCGKPRPGERSWSAREYFVSVGELVYVFGLASGDAGGDAELFDRIAARFEVVTT